jgi:hypothetical protein
MVWAMMYSRSEFKKILNSWKKGLGSENGPVWEGEKHAKVKCDWFVKIIPITDNFHVDNNKDNYWQWCNDTLTGKLLCISTTGNVAVNVADRQEWWGFTNKDDIPIWLLKWC